MQDDITIKGKGFSATYTPGAYYNWFITDTIRKEGTGFYNLTRGYSFGDDSFHPLGGDGFSLDRLQALLNLCTACKEKEQELRS